MRLVIGGHIAILFLLTAGCGNPANEQKENEAARISFIQAGKKVYEQHCLTCHQTGGTGVPDMNPPLKGSEYVVGDKGRLMDIVLRGSNEGLTVNGHTYSNTMPAHGFLSNRQIAEVLSYIRNSFGNKADTLSETEVEAGREALIGKR